MQKLVDGLRYSILGGYIMEKNMLILFGSPRKKGFTKQLLDLFLQQWQQQYPETNITFFYAYDEKMAPCTACRYCQHQLKCSIKDDEKFDRLYRKADVVVVASPVYGLSFPAPLKAVFDRTQQYYEARFCHKIKHPIEKPKVAFLLSTYGSEDQRGIEIMQLQLELMFSVMHTKLLGTVSVGNTDKVPFQIESAAEAVVRLLANYRDL